MTKSKVMLTLGAGLVVLSLVVTFVVSAVLVRFPLGTNQTMTYTGTATVGVNPSTLVPLASPLQFPLTIHRTVKVVSGSYSQAVVDETIHMTFAGSTRTETYQYVMNRRSMQLLTSPRSYAFGAAANRMSPNGSYRIEFPMSTAAVTYLAWAPETDSTATATPAGSAHRNAASGAQVLTFDTSLNHPVAPYYLAYLERGGLPVQLPSATVAAELREAGVAPSQLVQAVAPQLSAVQLSELLTDLATPASLTYSYFQQGKISVEPQTGAVIDAGSAREGVSVVAASSGLQRAVTLLAPEASMPAVKRFDALVLAMSHPQTVLSLSYAEIPASIRATAATAAHQADVMNLVQWQLPLILGVLGVVALVLAWPWRPRRTDAQILPVPTGRTRGGELYEQPPMRRHA